MIATLENGKTARTPELEFRTPRNREEAKEARREAKRLRKHQEDQVRLLDGWEQYRALWDGIDFKRQIINMGDKKVRFALVINGALNAMLLLMLTRGPVLRVMSGALSYTILALLAVYATLTFFFVSHAIEALRPKPEARKDDDDHWSSRETDGRSVPEGRRAVGYFIHGIALQRGFEEERQLWSQARLSEVNAELILFNRSTSQVLQRQLRSLAMVYVELKWLAILAAIVMAVVVTTVILQGGSAQLAGGVVG